LINEKDTSFQTSRDLRKLLGQMGQKTVHLLLAEHFGSSNLHPLVM
jgi:hypothetical protein